MKKIRLHTLIWKSYCIPLNCFDEIYEYSYSIFTKDNLYFYRLNKLYRGYLISHN